MSYQPTKWETEQQQRANAARKSLRHHEMSGALDREIELRRQSEIKKGHIWTPEGRRCGLMKCQPDCAA